MLLAIEHLLNVARAQFYYSCVWTRFRVIEWRSINAYLNQCQVMPVILRDSLPPLSTRWILSECTYVARRIELSIIFHLSHLFLLNVLCLEFFRFTVVSIKIEVYQKYHCHCNRLMKSQSSSSIRKVKVMSHGIAVSSRNSRCDFYCTCHIHHAKFGFDGTSSYEVLPSSKFHSMNGLILDK